MRYCRVDDAACAERMLRSARYLMRVIYALISRA